jgi:hypothetical protein
MPQRKPKTKTKAPRQPSSPPRATRKAPAAPVPTPARPRQGPKKPAQASQPVPPAPTPTPAPAKPRKAPAAAPAVDPFDATPSAPAAAPAVDPFDATPSGSTTALPRTMPGAYRGWYDGEGNHVCIAYKRTEFKILTLLMAQPIRIVEWPIDRFEEAMHPVAMLDGSAYALSRAVDIFLHSYNGHTDKALRVLQRLKTGRDVDDEDTLEDILDTTPSPIKGRVVRQGLTSDERKRKRRARRLAKLAALTPAELVDRQKRRSSNRDKRKAKLAAMSQTEREIWQAKRKARRAARKAAGG